MNVEGPSKVQYSMKLITVDARLSTARRLGNLFLVKAHLLKPIETSLNFQQVATAAGSKIPTARIF